MDTAARYFAYAQSKLQEVLEHEMPNIEKAAELVAESCKKGGKFYVFGSGHSHMVAEELYLQGEHSLQKCGMKNIVRMHYHYVVVDKVGNGHRQ